MVLAETGVTHISCLTNWPIRERNFNTNTSTMLELAMLSQRDDPVLVLVFECAVGKI